MREQTARPDGAKWAGVIAHAWPQGRVDLMFYGDDAIARLLGGGPDASGPLVRPPADPPAQQPSAPWPPSGGKLDRDTLTGEVTSAIMIAPELAGGDWDRVAVVVMMTAPGNGSAPGATVNAVRFYGERGHAVPTALGTLGPIGKLSRAIAAEDGVAPDAIVLRGLRGSRLDAYGFEGESAQRLVGGDARMLELSDWLRPT